ncbi:hypothetical protein PR048_000599 [Dryococelus australis]|uniref:Uncharacterized protein n=1 Tax=Dryococelus australis TaxID=614101 RepID=A0ABQ9IF34_9NEOP|nr:hypothetical protein PR048_000599 [Dryococelus australis]
MIEPVPPWWEVSTLTAHPPRAQQNQVIKATERSEVKSMLLKNLDEKKKGKNILREKLYVRETFHCRLVGSCGISMMVAQRIVQNCFKVVGYDKGDLYIGLLVHQTGHLQIFSVGNAKRRRLQGHADYTRIYETTACSEISAEILHVWQSLHDRLGACIVGGGLHCERNLRRKAVSFYFKIHLREVAKGEKIKCRYGFIDAALTELGDVTRGKSLRNICQGGGGKDDNTWAQTEGLSSKRDNKERCSPQREVMKERESERERERQKAGDHKAHDEVGRVMRLLGFNRRWFAIIAEGSSHLSHPENPPLGRSGGGSGNPSPADTTVDTRNCFTLPPGKQASLVLTLSPGVQCPLSWLGLLGANGAKGHASTTTSVVQSQGSRGATASLYTRLTARIILQLRSTSGALHRQSARLSPTKVNRAQSPVGSPDFGKWESCRTMLLVGGISSGISRLSRSFIPAPLIRFNHPRRLSRPRFQSHYRLHKSNRSRGATTVRWFGDSRSAVAHYEVLMAIVAREDGCRPGKAVYLCDGNNIGNDTVLWWDSRERLNHNTRDPLQWLEGVAVCKSTRTHSLPGSAVGEVFDTESLHHEDFKRWGVPTTVACLLTSAFGAMTKAKTFLLNSFNI